MPLTTAVVLLFVEISTHFVAARWLFFDHGVSGDKIIQSVNTLLLCFTFLGGRTVFQIYVGMKYMTPWIYSTMLEDTQEPVYKGLLILFVISVAINLCLNLFWSWLIVKQVVRIITRGSQVDKNFAKGIDGTNGTVELKQNDALVHKDAIRSDKMVV